MVIGYCFRFSCLLYISFNFQEVLHSLSPLYIGVNSTLQYLCLTPQMLLYHVYSNYLVFPLLKQSRFLPFLCVLVTELSLEPQNLCIFSYILRELTVMTNSCSLTNPTMGSCEKEVKISCSCSVYEANLFHLVYCIYQNLEEVDINKCSGSKCKQAKESEPFFQCPYVGLHQRVWLRLKMFTTLLISGPC